MQQASHNRFFQFVNIFFDIVAGAAQIDQGISHHLSGPMVGHLTSTVGGNHGYVARGQQMGGRAGKALGENGGMFTKPNFVGRLHITLGSEVLHGLVSI